MTDQIGFLAGLLALTMCVACSRTPAVTDIASVSLFERLTVDETHVYWTGYATKDDRVFGEHIEYAQIKRAPLAGGETEVLVDGGGGPGCIVRAGDHLIWETKGAEQDFARPDQLWRAQPDGQHARTLVNDPKLVRGAGLVTDGAHAYWASSNQIRAADIATGATRTVATVSGSVHRVTWIDGKLAAIVHEPLPNNGWRQALVVIDPVSGATQRLTGVAAPRRFGFIAADPQYVFVTVFEQERMLETRWAAVVRVPRSGGGAVELMEWPGFARGLALGERDVFLALGEDGGTGVIVRIAKRGWRARPWLRRSDCVPAHLVAAGDRLVWRCHSLIQTALLP